MESFFLKESSLVNLNHGDDMFSVKFASFKDLSSILSVKGRYPDFCFYFDTLVSFDFIKFRRVSL